MPKGILGISKEELSQLFHNLRLLESVQFLVALILDTFQARTVASLSASFKLLFSSFFFLQALCNRAAELLYTWVGSVLVQTSSSVLQSDWRRVSF